MEEVLCFILGSLTSFGKNMALAVLMELMLWKCTLYILTLSRQKVNMEEVMSLH